MVVPGSTASQISVWWLFATSLKQLLACLSMGLLLWLVMQVILYASPWLLWIIANQLVFLLFTFRYQPVRDFRMSMLAGVFFMLAAVALGLGYDVMLRMLFGAGTPTLGPWSEVRRMDGPSAAAILALGVLIGPAGDEYFFRASLFGSWQDAGRPWGGAFFSSALFALSRFDPWNLLAYLGLGILLCGAYRWTGSVLASWVAHALLNAVMMVLLFYGYE